MTESSYIFGSGPSILGLSAEEKDYLNHHPNTLAMNRYLMHWEMVGVLPKALILADTQFPSPVVMAETAKKAATLDSPVDLYLNEWYRPYFMSPFSNLGRGFRRRWGIWRRHRYLVPFTLVNRANVSFFSHTKLEPPGKASPMADSLDEPLYWYRGSLTTAINLASIIFPGTDIKLLGIDLDSFDPFYRGSEIAHPMLSRWTTKHSHDVRAQRLNLSTTVIPLSTGEPGILSVIPQIKQQLQGAGGDLQCCNPGSMLVTEGVCAYSPVIG